MNIHEMRANAATQLYTERKEEEIRKISNSLSLLGKTDLKDIKWVGPATVKDLISKGITTKEILKETKIVTLKKLITNPMSLKGVMKFLKTN